MARFKRKRMPDADVVRLVLIARGTGHEAEMAKNTLAREYLYLAIHWAHKYAHQHVLQDQIQECMIGLTEAIRRFDPNRGVQFATLASIWIRHHAKRRMPHEWNRDSKTRPLLIRDIDLLNVIADHKSPNPEVDASSFDLLELVNRLPASHRDVILSRFWGEATLNDVGTAMGLSRTRAHQLQKTALKKLRAMIERLK